MDEKEQSEKRNPSKPLTTDTYYEYQEETQQGHIKLFGYLAAVFHYDNALKQIEKAKTFNQMKKELIAFRKDRKNFDFFVNDKYNSKAGKFDPPETV